jgi:hypothetical protein
MTSLEYPKQKKKRIPAVVGGSSYTRNMCTHVLNQLQQQYSSKPLAELIEKRYEICNHLEASDRVAVSFQNKELWL